MAEPAPFREAHEVQPAEAATDIGSDDIRIPIKDVYTTILFVIASVAVTAWVAWIW